MRGARHETVRFWWNRPNVRRRGPQEASRAHAQLPSASGLVMISASISIALCVCERANSITSRNSFGEPPGLPEMPFGNGFDGPGVPQLLNHGEQTLRAVTGSGGRLHFGMVAGIKSERRPASNRNA